MVKTTTTHTCEVCGLEGRELGSGYGDALAAMKEHEKTPIFEGDYNGLVFDIADGSFYQAAVFLKSEATHATHGRDHISIWIEIGRAHV